MLDLDNLAQRSHRDVAGRLLAAGWDLCGIGDWAIAWRSPDGRLVARVCAFEPAYGVFTALCRTLPDSALLPRVELDAELRGGGRLTIMESLAPAGEGLRDSVLARWENAATDDPVTDVRSEAERLNTAAANEAPFWGGLDLNPGNVMCRADDEPVLVDLFYTDGEQLYRTLLEDPPRVAAAIPAHRREYIAEIAAIARKSTPEEIAAIRAAAASIA